MNRKHFLLALGLFLAVALAMFWLITMALSKPEPAHTTPVIAPPVPVQPAPVPHAPTGVSDPGSRSGTKRMAQSLPEPQPVPTPDTIAMTGMQPDTSNTWHLAPFAPSGALALLAAAVLLWQAVARIFSATLNVRGA